MIKAIHRLMVVSLLLITVVIIAGCGGSSGSTTDLNTAYLTVSPTSNRLEADVLTGNSCTTFGGAFETESIPITVTSTPYANATVKSPITINSIMISYSKYDINSAAPALPIQYDTGFTINPGTSLPINVNVAPDKLKFDMVDSYGFNLCSADYWEYDVTITFIGVENFTGKSFSISTKVKVAFADRENV